MPTGGVLLIFTFIYIFNWDLDLVSRGWQIAAAWFVVFLCFLVAYIVCILGVVLRLGLFENVRNTYSD